MARSIQLTFADPGHIDRILSDRYFSEHIANLKPVRTHEDKLVLIDPVVSHSDLDTEVVILSLFASGIKRILFPETPHQIEFLSPFPNQMKGGLHHRGEGIVTSTGTARSS